MTNPNFRFLNTDAYGTRPENYIQGEYAKPSFQTANFLVTLYGPFFADRFELFGVTENNGIEVTTPLVLGTDYELYAMFGIGSRIAAPATNDAEGPRKKIYYGVRLLNKSYQQYKMNYQAVGNLPWADKNDYDRMMSSFMEINGLYQDLKTLGIRREVADAVLQKLNTEAKYVDLIDPTSFKNPVYWQELPVTHQFFWMTIGNLTRPKPTATVQTPTIISPRDDHPVDAMPEVSLVCSPFRLLPVIPEGGDISDLTPDTIASADIEIWDVPRVMSGPRPEPTLLFSTNVTQFSGLNVTVKIPGNVLQNNAYRDFTAKVRYNSHIYGSSGWGTGRFQVNAPAVQPVIQKPTLVNFINEGNGANIVATKMAVNVPDTFASADWEVYSDPGLTQLKSNYFSVKETNYLVSALGVRLHDEIPQTTDNSAGNGLDVISWSFISDTEMLLCAHVISSDHYILAKIQFDEPRATFSEFSDLRSQKVVWEFSTPGADVSSLRPFQYAKMGSDGFIYVGGTAYEQFTPLGYVYGNNIPIVSKLDESGNVIWSKKYPADKLNQDFNLHGLQLDSNNNVYIYGNDQRLGETVAEYRVRFKKIAPTNELLFSGDYLYDTTASKDISPIVASVNGNGYFGLAFAVANDALDGNDFVVVVTNGTAEKFNTAKILNNGSVGQLHPLTCMTLEETPLSPGFTIAYVANKANTPGQMCISKFDGSAVHKKTISLNAYGHIYHFVGDVEGYFEVIGTHGSGPTREDQAFVLTATRTDNSYVISDQKAFTFVNDKLLDVERTAGHIFAYNGDNWIIAGSMLSRLYRNAPVDVENVFSQAEDAYILSSVDSKPRSIALNAYKTAFNVTDIVLPSVIANGTREISTGVPTDTGMAIFSSAVVAVDYDVRGFDSSMNTVPGIRIGKQGFENDQYYIRTRYNSVKGLVSDWSDPMPFSLTGTKLYQDYSEAVIVSPAPDTNVVISDGVTFDVQLNHVTQTGPVGSRNRVVITNSVWEISDITDVRKISIHQQIVKKDGDLLKLDVTTLKPFAIGGKYSLRVFLNGYLEDSKGVKLYPLTIGPSAKVNFLGPQAVVTNTIKTPTIVEPGYGQAKGGMLRISSDPFAMQSGSDTFSSADYEIRDMSGNLAASSYGVRPNALVSLLSSLKFDQVNNATGVTSGNLDVVDMSALPDGYVAILKNKELPNASAFLNYSFATSVARFDKRGDVIWSTVLPDTVQPLKVAAGNDGSIYIAANVSNSEKLDIAVMKLDTTNNMSYPVVNNGNVIKLNQLSATRGLGTAIIQDFKVTSTGAALISGISTGTQNFGFIASVMPAASTIIEFAEDTVSGGKLRNVSFAETTDGYVYALTVAKAALPENQHVIGFVPKAGTQNASAVKWQKLISFTGLSDRSVMKVTATAASNKAAAYLTKSDKNFVGFINAETESITGYELDTSATSVPAKISAGLYISNRLFISGSVEYEKNPALLKKNEALYMSIAENGNTWSAYQTGQSVSGDFVIGDNGTTVYFGNNTNQATATGYVISSPNRETLELSDVATSVGHTTKAVVGMNVGGLEVSELSGGASGAITYAINQPVPTTAKGVNINVATAVYTKNIPSITGNVINDLKAKLPTGGYNVKCRYHGLKAVSEWSTEVPFSVLAPVAYGTVPAPTVTYPTDNPSIDIKTDSSAVFSIATSSVSAFVGARAVVWTFYRQSVSQANKLTTIRKTGLKLNASELVGTPADVGGDQLYVTATLEGYDGTLGGESVPKAFTKNTVIPVVISKATLQLPLDGATNVDVKPGLWVNAAVFTSGTGVIDHTEWEIYEENDPLTPVVRDYNHRTNDEPRFLQVDTALKVSTKYNVYVVFVTNLGVKSPKELTGSFTTTATLPDKVAKPTVSGGGTITDKSQKVGVTFSDFAVETGAPEMTGYTIKITDVSNIASPVVLISKHVETTTNPGTIQYGFSDFGYNGRFEISIVYTTTTNDSDESTQVATVDVNIVAPIIKKPVVTEPVGNVTITPTLTASALEVLNGATTLTSATWEIWEIPALPPFVDKKVFTKTIQASSADPTQLVMTNPLAFGRQYKVRVSYLTASFGESDWSDFVLFSTETKSFTGKSSIEVPYIERPYQFSTVLTDVPGRDKIAISGLHGINNLFDHADLEIKFIDPDTSQASATVNRVFSDESSEAPQGVKYGMVRMTMKATTDTGLTSGLSEMLQVFVGSKSAPMTKPVLGTDTWGRPASSKDTVFGISPEATTLGDKVLDSVDWRITNGNTVWNVSNYKGETLLGKSYGPTEISLYSLYVMANTEAAGTLPSLYPRGSPYQFSARYRAKDGTVTDWSDWLTVGIDYTTDVTAPLIRCNILRQLFKDTLFEIYPGLGNVQIARGKINGIPHYKVVKDSDGSVVVPYTQFPFGGASDTSPGATLLASNINGLVDGESYQIWFYCEYGSGLTGEINYGTFIYRDMNSPADGSSRTDTIIVKPALAAPAQATVATSSDVAQIPVAPFQSTGAPDIYQGWDLEIYDSNGIKAKSLSGTTKLWETGVALAASNFTTNGVYTVRVRYKTKRATSDWSAASGAITCTSN